MKKLKGTLDKMTDAILKRGISSPGLTLDRDRQLLYLLSPEEYEEYNDNDSEEDEEEGEEDDEEEEDEDSEEDEEDEE